MMTGLQKMNCIQCRVAASNDRQKHSLRNERHVVFRCDCPLDATKPMTEWQRRLLLHSRSGSKRVRAPDHTELRTKRNCFQGDGETIVVGFELAHYFINQRFI